MRAGMAHDSPGEDNDGAADCVTFTCCGVWFFPRVIR